ncbi:MAG TPA: AmmeMemoRadiSam system radical SAM enzyme [Candidatus Ozemobacteraceae bacterium]|nr:AmmeMemoRadiSam system radical SAM enzyme [Candidatus Ozemobacteraceae bacterium]
MNRRRFLIDVCTAAAGISLGGLLLDGRAGSGLKAVSPERAQPEGPAGRHTYDRAAAEANLRALEAAGFSPRDAMYWSRTANGLIRCELCPRFCTLKPFERGLCRARISLENRLGTLVYGRPCSAAIDPIEKKPVFHFLPGSTAFSIATAGCLFGCRYCQNWQISQIGPEECEFYDLPPGRVVAEALANKCRSIAYTYTEPTIFYEYMLDTSKAARAAGLANIMISCGYINPEPLRELLPWLDVMKVDLKGFTERFYRSVCGGTLAPVLSTIERLAGSKTLVDIVTLVVPTLNDDPVTCSAMFRWLVEHAGPDISLFLSRFMPTYRLRSLPPTPPDTLERLRELAMQAGLRYVYLGNIPGHEGESTFCPGCKKRVVERFGYSIGEMHIRNGACAFCGTAIPGRWE